jgi:hypothetical protein
VLHSNHRKEFRWAKKKPLLEYKRKESWKTQSNHRKFREKRLTTANLVASPKETDRSKPAANFEKKVAANLQPNLDALVTANLQPIFEEGRPK